MNILNKLVGTKKSDSFCSIRRRPLKAFLLRIKKLLVLPLLLWRELKFGNACRAMASIASINLDLTHSPPFHNPRLLVDGCFLNLGYFYRMQLFRAATGSHSDREIGWVWRHNTRQCLQTLETLGINRAQVFHSQPDQACRQKAQKIVQTLRSAEDVLRIEFPLKMPSSFFYDYLLKCQRSASVNVADSALGWHLWDFLSSIHAAEKILEKHQPDMLAMSHSISLPCAPLSWIASQRGIPVVTLYGYCGLPRLWRMNQPEDIFYGMDRPRCEHLKALSSSQIDALANVGRRD